MTHQRIAGLDGLRALSVLGVLALHSQIPYARGGRFGVDVFFVLSGFLITRNILAEHRATGDISLKRFYWNRILRLAPPLVVMVMTVTLVLYYLYPQLGPGFIWQEAIPVLLYISNWTKIFFGYPQILGFTWTLAIEEQFYLLWPAVLLLVLSRGNLFVIRLALTVAALSALWRVTLTLYGPAERYWNLHGFDTHCDGLLIGAALALASIGTLNRLARFWLAALVILLLVLIAIGTQQFFPRDTAYGIGIAAVEICVAVIIAKIVTDQNCALTRASDIRPLATLGVISYAFYLWHSPILRVLTEWFGMQTWSLAAATFLLTVIASGLSWWIVERPSRKFRMPVPQS